MFLRCEYLLNANFILIVMAKYITLITNTYHYYYYIQYAVIQKREITTYCNYSTFVFNI